MLFCISKERGNQSSILKLWWDIKPLLWTRDRTALPSKNWPWAFSQNQKECLWKSESYWANYMNRGKVLTLLEQFWTQSQFSVSHCAGTQDWSSVLDPCFYWVHARDPDSCKCCKAQDYVCLHFCTSYFFSRAVNWLGSEDAWA